MGLDPMHRGKGWDLTNCTFAYDVLDYRTLQKASHIQL